MPKLFPSIVVGLGDAGSDIAAQVAVLLKESSEPEVAALTRTITIDGEGLRLLGSADAPADVELTSLDDRVAPGVWASNYRSLAEQSRTIRQLVERTVHEVRSYREAVGIGRRAVDVGESVTFYVVSSLCDPVGSAAIVPVLAIIGEAFVETFQGMAPRVHVTLLSHDLLPDGPGADPLLKARAFTALQEVEAALDGTAHLPHLLTVNLAWLLSSRNEENLFAGGYTQLVPVIAHQMIAMLRGEVLNDLSGTNMFHQRSHGRATRYSAFGFAKLIYPREQLLAKATDAVVSQTLAELPALQPVPQQASAVYADVKAFIHGNHLDDLAGLLERDGEGQEIWRPYTPPTTVADEEDATTALHRLDVYASGYEKEHATAMQRAIGQRRMQLLHHQQETLLARASEMLGTGTQAGSLASAEAWFAALVDDRAHRWIQGDPAAEPLTLTIVDQALHRYYDPQFSPLLFGESTDSDREAYAGRNRIASHDRRSLLRALEHDLDQKFKALEVAQVERAERLARLGDVERALAVEEDTDPVVSEPKEASLNVDGVEPASKPQRATRRGELLKGAVAEDSELAFISSTEGEVEQLTKLYADVHREVTRLNYAIDDAAERGRLFRRLLDALHERVGESVEAFREASQEYRSKRAQMEECAERRRGWVATAAAVAAGLLLVLAGVLLFFEPASRVPAEFYGGVVVIAAAYTGWRYWRDVGKQYRELLAAVAAVRITRDRKREAVATEQKNLQRFIFDHHRFSMLVDWRSELNEFLRGLRGQLSRFREDLDALALRSRTSADEWKIDENPFLEYLLPEGGVAGLLCSRQEELSALRREVWLGRDFATLFGAYQEDPDLAVTSFTEQVSASVRTVFRDIAAMSADEFFAHTHPAAQDRERRIVRVYRNAAPFAQRIAGDGIGSTERLTYVGVSGSSEASVVRGALSVADASNVFESRSDTEISIMRLALGFPAYHFAPMAEARSHFEQLPLETQRMLYVDDAWLPDLQDLQPSVLRLGGADDERRRMACLAIAYGIASVHKESAGTRIRYGGSEFESYDAWVLHLGHLRGASDRSRLEIQLREIRERSATDIPSASQLLDAYRAAHPDLDLVDMEIIQGEMSML